MKNAVLFLVGIFVSNISFAALKTVRQVHYITPSSFSCYNEGNSSQPSLSVYVGEYITNNEGRVFNYYKTTDSFTMSSNELCRKMRIDFRTLGHLNYSEKWTTLFIDENDILVGYTNPLSKDLIILNF